VHYHNFKNILIVCNCNFHIYCKLLIPPGPLTLLMLQPFPLLPLPFLHLSRPPPYTFLLYVHLLGTFIYQSCSSSFSYLFPSFFSFLFSLSLSLFPLCADYKERCEVWGYLGRDCKDYCPLGCVIV